MIRPVPDPGAARVPVCLSIAGSDSGGGAGIQADLKAFARSGVHGTTAITAITAQSTVEVRGVEPISPGMILLQVRAVVEDLGVDAVKIGMVGGEEAIEAVAFALDELPPGTPIVLDPVMIAESGARLLPGDAQRMLARELVSRATVVTPNLPEARALAAEAGVANPEQLDAPGLARAIHTLGPRAVLVTGGHREEATDLLYDGETLTEIPGPRHPAGAAHGSGCTHSSTLAAQLALGHDLVTAARTAKEIAAAAVRDGLRDVGHGAGPVNVLGLRPPGTG
jgi:hydroxymethylpyrimidine/phosphomethylpyrimidine kinase